MARTKNTLRSHPPSHPKYAKKGLLASPPKARAPAKKGLMASSPARGPAPATHKFRPGTRALMEIRRFQKQTGLLIARAPFARFARRVGSDHKDDVRFRPAAMDVLQEATEAYILSILQNANSIAIHSKRVTLMPKDIKLAVELRTGEFTHGGAVALK